MLIAIVMLRDETDILPAWLRHMTAICDQVFAVDHLSRDGSSEILQHFAKAGLPIRTWTMNDPGHWQADVSTELARLAFREGADWVLPFDVDEFLDVESKEELETLLQHQKDPLAFWRWRHLTPSLDTLRSGNLDLESGIFIANPKPAESWLGKIMVHKTAFQKLPGFRLGHGNHKFHGVPFAKAIRGRTVGTLWHLPVRSREQMIRKLSRDVGSYSNAQGIPLPELEGAAPLKAQLLQRLSASPDDMEMLQRLGLGYWEKGIYCLDDRELLQKAVTVAPKIAMINLPQPPPVSTVTERVTSRTASSSRTTHSLVQARLSTTTVEIASAGTRPRLLHGLEKTLAKFFTPGLRLARFIATRFVAWRLDMPARAKD